MFECLSVNTRTFLLPGEGHYILSVLVLHGFLLQVFEKTVPVERSRRLLSRLVLLT